MSIPKEKLAASRYRDAPFHDETFFADAADISVELLFR